ncbi:MAG: hypothetical protein LBM23_06590 [Propionibacteriaceae bacterium]|jgi:hypothetical protein|nr:hypothetical protein [Propionibacteriaceae bacterium]
MSQRPPSSAPSQEPPLSEWLGGLPSSLLVDIITRGCAIVPGFLTYVEQRRVQSTHGDVAAGERALAALPRVDVAWDDLPWNHRPGVSFYSDDIRQTLEPLMSAAEERPQPGLLTLIEQAISSISLAFKDMAPYYDEEGEVYSLVEELSEILKRAAAACADEMDAADRVALADWIWDGASNLGDYTPVGLRASAFAEALGVEGREHLRALTQAAGSEDSWRMREAIEDFAVLDRDPDAVIAVFGGDLGSAGACWNVVTPLVAIGRTDLATEYARRGLEFEPDQRRIPVASYFQLADFLTDEALKRGDIDEALWALGRAVHAMPSERTYTKLRDLALAHDRWEDLRPETEAWMEAQAPDGWILALIDEDRVDEAWKLAPAQRKWLEGRGQWDHVLAVCGRKHPAEVLTHYRRLIDDDLSETGRHRYERAAERLIQLREFSDMAGRHDAFVDYLRLVWEGARRRPLCKEIFTASGLSPTVG